MGVRSLLYTHPDMDSDDSHLHGLIGMTRGLKLSEVAMEREEMEGLNEIMNSDDFDSADEEFLFEVPGECGRCGRLGHDKLKHCPAKGKTCTRCGKKNHFKIRCKTKCENCG